MNPNTRGAANSLYRSTGRGSQRKAMQEWTLCFTEDIYGMETKSCLPSQMYENKKPRVIKEREQVSAGVDQNFLKQKRANSAFEFFMRQRQGMSEDIAGGFIEMGEIQAEAEPTDMAGVTASTYPRYQ